MRSGKKNKQRNDYAHRRIHPTVLPEETLADENIDFVVLGEGESSTKELLDALRGNKDFTLIDGIAFRAHGKMQINKKTRFIDDLDRLPFPARHLLPMEKYFKINLLMESQPAMPAIPPSSLHAVAPRNASFVQFTLSGAIPIAPVP